MIFFPGDTKNPFEICKLNVILFVKMTAMFNEMKNSIAQEIKQYLLTTIRQDIVTLMQRVQAKTVEEVLLELEDKTDDDNSKTVTKFSKHYENSYDLQRTKLGVLCVQVRQTSQKGVVRIFTRN
jgi:hypothetical protein